MSTFQSRGEWHACYVAARELRASLFSRADKNRYRQQSVAMLPVEKNDVPPFV